MKPTRKNVLGRVLKQLKKYRLWMIATILFATVTVAGNLAVPIFFGRAIDLIVDGKPAEVSGLLKLFALTGGVIAVTCISQWFTGIINDHIAYNVVKDIRNEAFEKIQRLPLKFIDGHSAGDLLGRMIADVDQFADGLLLGFTQLFTGVLTIAGTLAIMLVINWIIALIVVFLTPLSLFVAKFIAGRTYSMFKKTSEARGEQAAFVDEMIGNLKVVQAFSHEDENLEKFDEINSRLTKASLRSIFFSSLVNPCTRFINSVVYAAVALAGALMLVLGTPLPVTFSVGILTGLLSYANQYAKPFNEISGVVTELQNAVACAGRIYEVIDEPAEKPDVCGGAIGRAEGNVEFKEVFFSYSQDKKLIENFNINVRAGMHVAIVGPTGCGKTTLINLLMRFYEPCSGNIFVDGEDILKMPRKSLRSSFGMVLQDTWLKCATVRENIMIGKPGASEEEIVNAAKAAYAHNFIMQLPNGYNTVLPEDGGNLSQGQKQLLCIARVMLSMPPMLILDEATSSIDTRTEKRIQNAFYTLTEGKTSFVVAHRLSTVQNADLIVVMKDGKIEEQGTHGELMALKGFYYSLYNSSFAVV